MSASILLSFYVYVWLHDYAQHSELCLTAFFFNIVNTTTTTTTTNLASRRRESAANIPHHEEFISSSFSFLSVSATKIINCLL